MECSYFWKDDFRKHKSFAIPTSMEFFPESKLFGKSLWGSIGTANEGLFVDTLLIRNRHEVAQKEPSICNSSINFSCQCWSDTVQQLRRVMHKNWLMTRLETAIFVAGVTLLATAGAMWQRACSEVGGPVRRVVAARPTES
jgi:hypothetical protein